MLDVLDRAPALLLHAVLGIVAFHGVTRLATPASFDDDALLDALLDAFIPARLSPRSPLLAVNARHDGPPRARTSFYRKALELYGG